MTVLILKGDGAMNECSECGGEVLNAGCLKCRASQRAMNYFRLLDQVRLLGQNLRVQFLSDQRERNLPGNFQQRQIKQIGFFAKWFREILKEAWHSQADPGQITLGY